MKMNGNIAYILMILWNNGDLIQLKITLIFVERYINYKMAMFPTPYQYVCGGDGHMYEYKIIHFRCIYLKGVWCIVFQLLVTE